MTSLFGVDKEGCEIPLEDPRRRDDAAEEREEMKIKNDCAYCGGLDCDRAKAVLDASERARKFLEEIASMLPTTHNHQCMEIITAIEDAIRSATP